MYTKFVSQCPDHSFPLCRLYLSELPSGVGWRNSAFLAK